MGILDDAIREHLELKRSHGAAEEEVRLKEAEAFGPVRSDVAPSSPMGDETQLLAPADAVLADPAEPRVEDASVAEPVRPDLEIEPAVVDPHDHERPAGADPAWAEDTEFFSEPAAPPAADAPPAAEAGAGMMEPSAVDPGPPPPPDHGSGHEEPHPALHDHDAFHSEEHPPAPVFREEPSAHEAPPVADAPAPPEPASAEDGDEDVLEETPEFLQDAPEHDRLWFEQRPPRDFDFGE